jgi:hypothetical protein
LCSAAAIRDCSIGNPDIFGGKAKKPAFALELAAFGHGVMKELMDTGKIRHWGLSEAGVETIRKAHAVCPVSVVEREYSMFFRSPEEALLGTLEELLERISELQPVADVLELATAGLLPGQFAG